MDNHEACQAQVRVRKTWQDTRTHTESQERKQRTCICVFFDLRVQHRLVFSTLLALSFSLLNNTPAIDADSMSEHETGSDTRRKQTNTNKVNQQMQPHRLHQPSNTRHKKLPHCVFPWSRGNPLFLQVLSKGEANRVLPSGPFPAGSSVDQTSCWW